MDGQTYGPLELPSGKKIKFRQDYGRDRANVIKAQKMTYDNIASASLLVEGLVATKCIIDIDGVMPPINQYKELYDVMPSADLDFYLAVRQEMFGMTEEKRTNAKEMASFLLNKQTSTDLSSLPSTDTSAATENG